jgi:hypothetical protein
MKNVLDETQFCHCICIDLAAGVQCNDAHALLPAVKLLQAKVAERRRIRVANDSEHAALLSGMVVTVGVEEKRHDAVKERDKRRGAAARTARAWWSTSTGSAI